MFCILLHWIWRSSTSSPIAPVWHRDYPRSVTRTIFSPALSYGDFMWKISHCKCYSRPNGGGAMYSFKPASLSAMLRCHVLVFSVYDILETFDFLTEIAKTKAKDITESSICPHSGKNPGLNRYLKCWTTRHQGWGLLKLRSLISP